MVLGIIRHLLRSTARCGRSFQTIATLTLTRSSEIRENSLWQRIENQIAAALVTARASIVNVLWADHRAGELLAAVLA
jgi:hypothetical protein